MAPANDDDRIRLIIKLIQELSTKSVTILTKKLRGLIRV